MRTIAAADHGCLALSRGSLQGKQLKAAKKSFHVRIESKIVARNRKKRNRQSQPEQRFANKESSMRVLELPATVPVGLGSSVLGMESEDDVDLQFLQSDDSDSEEEIIQYLSASRIESFPFELDKFQSVAIKELLTGKSVVVCAPTGAGKTAIADAATLASLSKGKKVIYTTPLKALSNQKLYEFRQRFGEEKTGLITGDTNIQINAPVIVMTTEILRNMFYDVTTSPGLTRRLDEIGMVVLDEVHYLGDPGRGSVWEELIVGCPKHIQMLCMSATVANPQDLGDWITQIHGPCTTVKTSKRPVPLSWFFSFSIPKTNRTELCSLLNKEKTDVNPACVYKDEAGFGKEKPRDINPASRVPVLDKLLMEMKRRGFLPAIFFIFSRADCDKQAERMQDFGVCFTTPEEQAVIRKALREVEADQPEAIKADCQEALINGIATHHAGCLPAWKLLVETLFQNGYLKVVFATGTLAAGINMPARTTVISTLSKRIDGNMALVGHNELLQMAGRAGRRGYDTAGNCVILQSKFEGAAEAVSILKGGTEPLISQFTTGYSFVLNLLAKFTLVEAKEFLEKSFRNYLTGVGLVRRAHQIEELRATAKKLRIEARGGTQGSSDEEDGPDQAELKLELKEAQRELREVLKRAYEERSQAVEKRLKGMACPVPVLIDTTKNSLGHEVMPAVALARRQELQGKVSIWKIYCLGADNMYYRLTYRAIVGAVFESMGQTSEMESTTSRSLSPKLTWIAGAAVNVESCKGNKHTAKVAYRVPPVNRFERISWSNPTELMIDAKNALIKKCKRELRKSDKLLKGAGIASDQLNRSLRSAERQLQAALRLKRELESQKEQGWKGFTSTMAILIKAGAVDGETLELKPLGHVTRELFGDHELWMALVFTHPSVQLLRPSLLAALASSFAAPSICSKPTLFIETPPPEEIEQLLVELDGPRQQLYEDEVTVGAVSPQSLSGLQMDPRAAGLVEAWAAGCLWGQLTSATNMDDGDLARLLTRTLDILRQVYLSNHLLDPLKDSARAAHRSMNRKPIRYDIV